MALHPFFYIVLLSMLFNGGYSGDARGLFEIYQPDPSMVLKYHNGSLLTGNISVNLIWYGKFSPSQKSVITDFINSLNTPVTGKAPSVATWWKGSDKYYTNIRGKKLVLRLGSQLTDEQYSLGKTLSEKQILRLAYKGAGRNAINVVLTSSDVVVDRFCMSRCGTHGSAYSTPKMAMGRRASKFAYIWVGNAATQCPGFCAWPFSKPLYGPQGPPLVAPNGDVGIDGMVMTLATLLAGTATNPFGDGYFQGPKEAPLEAASACPGVFGKGAYPGYAGDLLLDSATGGSHNTVGVNAREFLLPALYDPTISTCSPVV